MLCLCAKCSVLCIWHTTVVHYNVFTTLVDCAMESFLEANVFAKVGAYSGIYQIKLYKKCQPMGCHLWSCVQQKVLKESSHRSLEAYRACWTTRVAFWCKTWTKWTTTAFLMCSTDCNRSNSQKGNILFCYWLSSIPGHDLQHNNNERSEPETIRATGSRLDLRMLVRVIPIIGMNHLARYFWYCINICASSQTSQQRPQLALGNSARGSFWDDLDCSSNRYL